MPSITWVECDAEVAEEALNKARQMTTEALLPNPCHSAMDRGDRYLIADAGTFKLTYDRQTKLFELGHCAEE